MNLIHNRQNIQQALLDTNNIYLPSQRRQDAINRAQQLFDSGILDAATHTFGTTKPQPLITRAELSEIAAMRHLGNLETANTLISDLESKIALEYSAKKINMNNTDIIKKMDNQRRRISRESDALNPRNIEECLEKWILKWKLQ